MWTGTRVKVVALWGGGWSRACDDEEGEAVGGGRGRDGGGQEGGGWTFVLKGEGEGQVKGEAGHWVEHGTV